MVPEQPAPPQAAAQAQLNEAGPEASARRGFVTSNASQSTPKTAGPYRLCALRSHSDMLKALPHSHAGEKNYITPKFALAEAEDTVAPFVCTQQF